MIDLTALYSSQKVLFWLAVLGLYGTCEGVGRLVKGLPPLFRRINNHLRSKTHDVDYFFAYRESGYVVMPGGSDFVNSRRERVVAVKRLEGVPFTYRWSGDGAIEEELFPDSYSLETLPRV